MANNFIKSSFRLYNGYLFNNRILTHIIFWLFLYVFFLYPLLGSPLVKEILIGNLFYAPVFLFCGYMTLYIYIPELLKKKKISTFLIKINLLIIISAFILTGIKLLILRDILSFYFWKSTFSRNIFGFLITLYMVVGLVTVIKLIRREYRNEIDRLDIEKRLSEMQLSLLKAQTDPHFIFNTLNNINSLVFRDQQKTYDSILTMSEMMRYMFYEAKSQSVLLKEDIENIKNYIALQQLRYSGENIIVFKINGHVKEQQIAPLIYIPLIENAFRYCRKGKSDVPWINIDLKVTDQSVEFNIRNFKKTDTTSHESGTGTGIISTKKRLELIYPGRHILDIKDNCEEFRVGLEIYF